MTTDKDTLIPANLFDAIYLYRAKKGPEPPTNNTRGDWADYYRRLYEFRGVDPFSGTKYEESEKRADKVAPKRGATGAQYGLYYGAGDSEQWDA